MSTDKEAKIREAAHRLWVEEGHPEGREVAHWLMAESTVQAQAKPKRATAKAPAKATSLAKAPIKAKAPPKTKAKA